MRRRRFLGAALGGLAAHALPARAQDFPRHAVRILVPFSAGLGPDAVLRTVAEHLSRTWGHPVVIDNRPGASGLLAQAEAKRAAPDGHTLLLAEAGAMTVVPYITPNAPVDPRRDFAPLTTVFRARFVLVTSAAGPYGSLSELVARARATPGKVSYASFGNGHASQIAVENLAARLRLDLLHVPYRDGGQLIGDVARGEVGFTAISHHSVAGLVAQGRLRALAVGVRERLRELPDVPTLAQAGVPDLEMSPWAALFAPSGVPEVLLDRLGRDLRATLDDAGVKARIEGMGFEVVGSTAKALGERVARETEQNAALIRTGRIRAE